MTNKQQQTPLEKLISDRQRLQEQCAVQEQKLNEHFTYIQENAGSLLLSGVSALLFPKTKTKNTEKESSIQPTEVPSVSFGFSDYLSVAQSLFPIAWDVIRPLITAWGIKKVQTWVIKKLFKKKK